MTPRVGGRYKSAVKAPAFLKSREFATACVLAAMLAACETASWVNTNQSFLNSDGFVRLFRDSSFVGLAALGACAVIISGGVDLSSGSVMGLASVVLAFLYTRKGWAPAPALAVALVVGTAVGMTSGALVGFLRLPPFIATLGFLSIARGLSYWVSDTRIPIEWKKAGPAVFAVPGTYTFWLMVGLGALATLVLARFSWGRYVYAVGGNEEAARFAGLRIAWIKTGIYAAAGLFAGLAGSSLALYYGSGYVELGRGYELQIIAACAIGGVSFSGGQGSVLGAVLGAVTLQVLQILLIQLNVRETYIEIAYGAAIILAVAVDQLRQGSVLAKWFGRKAS